MVARETFQDPYLLFEASYDKNTLSEISSLIDALARQQGFEVRDRKHLHGESHGAYNRHARAYDSQKIGIVYNRDTILLHTTLSGRELEQVRRSLGGKDRNLFDKYVNVQPLLAHTDPSDIKYYESRPCINKKERTSELDSNQTRMLQNVLKLRPHQTSRHFAPPKQFTIGVGQEQYGVTGENCAVTWIGTSGLGPCIGLALYNEKEGTVLAAHFDGTETRHSIKDAISSFPKPAVAHMVGGTSRSTPTVVKILEVLQEERIKVLSADIMCKPHKTEFIIGAREGDFMPGVTPQARGFTHQEELEAASRMLSHSGPTELERAFDGFHLTPEQEAAARGKSAGNRWR
jgi:hypothetical protein